jgi:hypothetical protein
MRLVNTEGISRRKGENIKHQQRSVKKNSSATHYPLTSGDVRSVRFIPDDAPPYYLSLQVLQVPRLRSRMSAGVRVRAFYAPAAFISTYVVGGAPRLLCERRIRVSRSRYVVLHLPPLPGGSFRRRSRNRPHSSDHEKSSKATIQPTPSDCGSTLARISACRPMAHLARARCAYKKPSGASWRIICTTRPATGPIILRRE